MERTLLLSSTGTFLTTTKTFKPSSTTGTQSFRSPLIRSPRITITTSLFHTSSVSFGSKHSLLGITIAPVLCVSSSGGDISSVSSEDVILLDVRGMMCGGCASSVKKILENQAQVSSAAVDLTTETATVWPVAEAKATPNWQKAIGEELAKNLTNCGFDSNLKGEAAT